MNILPYEVDWNETAKVFISVLALTVSVVTIIITRRNLKKQIRTVKLEEIMEILSFLQASYNILFWFYSEVKMDIIPRKNPLVNDMALHLQRLKKNAETFQEQVGKNIIADKIIRLKVLANSYLPNDKRKLKIRIIALANMYMRLYASVRDANPTYNTGYRDFPLSSQYNKFNELLQKELISEMKLGFKGFDQKNLEQYAANQMYDDMFDLNFK